MEAAGEPLNIARGGILVRSRVIPAEGTEFWVYFTIQNHPEAFITHGRIVRAQRDVLAVAFLEEPAGLERILESLEPAQEPQAGTVPLNEPIG